MCLAGNYDNKSFQFDWHLEGFKNKSFYQHALIKIKKKKRPCNSIFNPDDIVHDVKKKLIVVFNRNLETQWDIKLFEVLGGGCMGTKRIRQDLIKHLTSYEKLYMSSKCST